MFSLLHIDNNIFCKEFLRDLAQRNDCQYFSAKTPEKGCEILNAYDIDLIITGLKFGEESEEDFIRKLMRKKRETTPLIVLSASDDAALKTRLLSLGVSDYLTKDHLQEYLPALIRKVQAGDFIASQLRNLQLAVLDDSEMFLYNIRTILERNRISHVDYYLHPTALLSTHKTYNIYIIDIILPDIYGEKVIAEIRRRDEYAVIIAISIVGNHADISSILSAGADDYIVKLFSENLIMARIKANVRTYTLMEQLKERNMRLDQLAHEDGLTGLYNHRAIVESLGREIDRVKRNNMPLTVLMFDIDRFKVVNDTYGHHTGDEVLFQIGKHLKNDSRRIDIVGRYGGEEFICILQDTDLSGAVIYAERLRQDCEEMRFNESRLSITISGGLVEYSGEAALDLVKRADEFLYVAKRKGRNRIEY